MTFLLEVWGWKPLIAQCSRPISADVKLVSDYRFRGISASSQRPALQVGIDVAKDGFVTGVWASTTSDYHGSHLETDWYAGGEYSYRQINLTLVGYAFIYPGGSHTTTLDLEGSVAAPFGKLKTNLQIAFSPRQKNSNRDNFYVSETVLFPLNQGRWLIVGHYGFETGIYRNKQDWKIAVKREGHSIGVELGLIGSNYSKQIGPNAGTGLVESISIAF